MNGLDVLIALTAALFAFLLGVYAYRVKQHLPVADGFVITLMHKRILPEEHPRLHIQRIDRQSALDHTASFGS